MTKKRKKTIVSIVAAVLGILAITGLITAEEQATLLTSIEGVIAGVSAIVAIVSGIFAKKETE